VKSESSPAHSKEKKKRKRDQVDAMGEGTWVNRKRRKGVGFFVATAEGGKAGKLAVRPEGREREGRRRRSMGCCKKKKDSDLQKEKGRVFDSRGG